MKINSYSKLAEINIFYKEFVKKEYGESVSKKILSSTELKIALSLLWIGKDPWDVDYFQSNNYFVQALNIKQLLNKNDLENFLNANNHFNKNGKNFNFVKYLADLVLNNFIKKNKNKTYSLWTKEKKQFFEKNGYVVIPNVFDSKTCDKYRKDCLNLARKEKNKNCSYHYGFNNKFQRVYNVLNKSNSLGMLIDHPLVNLIMNDIFNRETYHEKYTLSSHHINIIPPGGEAQILHLDAAVPEPLPPWIIRANVNFIFEDYSKKNGATQCIPGSHKFLKKPKINDERLYQDKLKSINAKKGSIVIWHGHLWHKSGENKSDSDRVALLTCFASSFMIEMALEENNLAIINKYNLKKYSKNIQKLVLANHGFKTGYSFKT